MPMAEGESFAGYTVVRLLGVGAVWVRCTGPGIPGYPRNDALRCCRAR